jgi:hypothetical protein
MAKAAIAAFVLIIQMSGAFFLPTVYVFILTDCTENALALIPELRMNYVLIVKSVAIRLSL